MYVYYSEEEADAEIHHRRSSIGGPERTFRRAKRAIYVLIAATAFAMTILLVSVIILHFFGSIAQTWADILGIAVAVFACIQWVPQVYTSIHLGHLGSLSLASLCISAPVSLILTLGWGGVAKQASTCSIPGSLASACSSGKASRVGAPGSSTSSLELCRSH